MYTPNNPNAMSVLLLFWCFSLSRSRALTRSLSIWVTILEDDIYQVNWSILHFAFSSSFSWQSECMWSTQMFFICIYLSHVYVARLVSVSCSINMDIELYQISSLTFYGRTNDFILVVSGWIILVLYNLTFIILFILNISNKKAFRFSFLLSSSYENISFVGCEEWRWNKRFFFSILVFLLLRIL